MMSRILHYFKLYPLPFLSGILIGTSFIPFPPWALFFCYLPLWYFALTPTPSLRQVFWGGWWTQFILTLIGFHWIAFTAHEFGFFPWPFAVATLLLFAATMHLYIPLSLLAGVWLHRRLQLGKGATVLILATLATLGEMFWPSIFEWNLGYPLLWTHSPLAQWADTVGFQGLSFAIYLINAWVLWLILKKDKKAAGFSALIFLAMMALLSLGGLKKAEYWKNTDAEIKALVVQANIGNQEKYYAERGAGFQQFIADEFFNLTRQGLAVHADTQLIIWPESAFPDYLDNFAASRRYPSQFRQFSQSIAKPILTGAFSKDGPEVAKPNDYNGLFLFDEKGQILGEPYHKTELLIFGETIPLVDTFPILAKYNPGGAGFGRGQGPHILKWGEVQIGGQICYESLDPHFSAGLSQKGADILVNVTNDSWFGPYFEPYQHLYMTLARGLEVRRPLVRSTNTGVSSAILADGTVLEESPIGRKWFGQYLIKYKKNAEVTVYAKIGAWLWLMLSLFLVVLITLGRKRVTKF